STFVILLCALEKITPAASYRLFAVSPVGSQFTPVVRFPSFTPAAAVWLLVAVALVIAFHV
ncbi:hypothetical protein, partial [Pseudomonas sp. GP01-A5]|uniref:hypothetical protein n=1 Tax=Pseudomonas sp. GP01-A5 TaxID=2070563 RepID=UPI001C48810C